MESLNEFVERELPNMKNFLDLISVSLLIVLINVNVLLKRNMIECSIRESSR